MRNVGRDAVIVAALLLLFLTGCTEQKATDKAAVPDEELEQKGDVAVVDNTNAGEKTGAEQPKLRPVYDYVFDLKDKEAVSQSSGTGGTEWKGKEAYSENGEPKSYPVTKLSGAFYNGVNYIEYINNELAKQIAELEEDEFKEMDIFNILKRPFTGISKDYCYFEVYHGKIDIEFPEGNPFFKNKQYFDIHLDKAISPYGEDTEVFHVDYKLLDLGNGITILQPIFTLQDKNISNKLNSNVALWVSNLQSKLTMEFDQYDIPYEIRIDAHVDKWGDYISISYFYDSDEMPWLYNRRLLATATYDKRTGETADLVSLISKDFDWDKAAIFPKATYESIKNDNYEYYTETISEVPKENASFINAYLYCDLVFDVIQPDGAWLTVHIPYEEIGKILGKEFD